MKVLLAIDNSKFSEAATQHVASQCRSEDTEILVLNVVEPISTSPPPQMSPGYYPELEDQVRQARALVEEADRTLSLAGFRVSTSVAEGNAKSVILDKAAEWRAGLIVLGSHGRMGLERFLLGSVSEAVARHAHCSVLIVRMPG